MRQRLNNRRATDTFVFELNGHRYTASVGRFIDGRIAELFVNSTKTGSQSDTNARDAAVAVSLALQYGCPVETLAAALARDERGEALGPITKALDIIQKWETPRG